MVESPLASFEASEQQIAPATVQPNRMNGDTPATAAFEQNPADKTIEESDALASFAASNDDMPHNVAKPDQPRVSRFAILGLNAHPIDKAGQKDTGGIKSTHKLILANDFQPNSIAQQRKVIKDVDMEELEELLIPADHRQAYREQGPLPIDPRPKTSNNLKYGGTVVTNLGWRPMHNQNARVVRGPIETSQEGGIINNNLTEQDILTEKLRKYAAIEAERSLQQLDDERELAELLEEYEKPLVDEKYFGLENYLKHSGQSEEGRLDERDELNDPLDAQPSVVAPQALIPTGRILRDRLNENKEEAKAAPDAYSSLSSDLNEAVNSSADIPNEVNDGRQGEPALERTGKFELIGDNSYAVAVGQPAPEKLCIRLHCVDTDGDETFTFTNISHDAIDWSNKNQILSINKWRYGVFHSRGIAVKRIFFHSDEEAWLVLFHKKIKLVVEAGHMIKLPGPVPTMESFNRFFVGKVLQDASGDDLLPREPRDETSMKSKFQHVNSGFKNMRDVMRKLLEGKNGGVLYVPVITEDEFLLYKKDGTVSNDDPTEEGKNVAVVDGAGRRRTSPKRKREPVVGDSTLEKRSRYRVLHP